MTAAEYAEAIRAAHAEYLDVIRAAASALDQRLAKVRTAFEGEPPEQIERVGP